MKCQTLGLCVCVLLAAVSATSIAAPPANPWTITTADFQLIDGATLSFNGNGIVITSPNEQQRTLPWNQFLSAQRDQPSSASPGPFELHLISGDRVGGEPVGIGGQSLKWKNPVAGELTLELSQVDRIAKPGVAARSEAATADVVSLNNGDEVRGIITGLADGKLQLQGAAGDVVEVPLDALVSVRFAATARQKPESPERSFRVSLSDGSTLSSTVVKVQDDSMMLQLSGDASPRQVPVSAVTGVEQLNGPVAWLSSLPPSSDEQVPFLGKPMPSRMDRTVTGDVIRHGDHAYARGIGVHARSRITWPVDGRYSTFRTRYALDGDLPYANVTVRIKLDDKVVHEKTDFTAGELSPVIQLPLEGAETITLEVDYGQTYDVQDRLNWIEPALLK